jgi:hypothetical protein
LIDIPGDWEELFVLLDFHPRFLGQRVDPFRKEFFFPAKEFLASQQKVQDDVGLVFCILEKNCFIIVVFLLCAVF